MPAPTDEQLQALLLDPDCPYGLYWEQYRSEKWDDLVSGRARARRTTKPIEVHALKRFVRERYGDDPALEDRLDSFIRSIGGERLRVIDPWSLPRRALRRIAGRKSRSRDVYEIPEKFFEPSPPPSGS